MAIRINRVYTRTGDDGSTGLVGGARVAKDSLRVESYGAIDELSSIVGMARVFNSEEPPGPVRFRVEEILRRLQNELFDLGSELATSPDAVYEGMFRVSAADVRALEAAMDECQKDLEPLKSFVLPGGGRVSGLLHVARTVCRRAEREVLRLNREEPVGEFVLAYLNRLSDLFFVLSRWVGNQRGESEYLWERGLRNQARPVAAKPKKKRK
jgi:cob(I)alamin adenosyltransferase